MPSITNLLSGPVQIFTAPVATAFPAALDTKSTGILLASDFTGASFVEFPYTTEGASLNLEVSLFEKKVQECLATVGVDVQEVKGQISIECAESDTAAQLLAFANGAITTVAAGSGQVGKKEFFIDMSTSVATVKALALLGKSPGGFSDIWCAPKVVPMGGVTTVFKKGNLRTFAVNFLLMEDPTAADAQNRFIQRHMITATPT